MRAPCLLAVVLLIAGTDTGVARAQLAPEGELAALRPADGLQVELFAAEPLVVNPAAIDVDAQGRVWAAEIRYYRRAAKQPPADRIVVLEDTDGDGRADRSTVFAEGLFCPMSICVAWPKIYVATSPDLWVFEDRNDDLKADGPPKKLLTGFGGFNHDHGAHSLVLGPDHKWWMSHGDEGFDVTGVDGSRVKFRWGATLRGELDGSQLETVAVNFRNPYEVCVSSFGESYLSDNDNDGNFSTRICWLLDGGDYGWYGAPPAKVDASIPFAEGWHFRAHVPGHVPGSLVTGFGSPCGMCFYEGDAFGDLIRDVPLHAEAGPREVRAYPHERVGFGQRGSTRVLLTSEGDDYFRPDDVCVAPDGTLFVSDWYDGGVGGHAYNNPEQGRIFVVRPAGERPARREKPGPYHDLAAALAALASPNLATQFLAREWLLANPEASTPALIRLVSSQRTDNPNLAARALWVLDRLGGKARNEVVAQLQSADPRFRELAVRILRRRRGDHAEAILALSGDPSPEVRREVLLSLPAIDGSAAVDVLRAQMASFVGDDRYELETLRIAARGREAELFATLAAPTELTAARIQVLQLLDADKAAGLLDAGLRDANVSVDAKLQIVRALAASPSPEAAATLMALAADRAADVSLRAEALARLNDNLSGPWRQGARDEQLVKVLASAAEEPALKRAVIALIQKHGAAPMAAVLRPLVGDRQLEAAVRAEAVTALAGLRQGAELFPGLLADPAPAVQAAALAALVDLQQWAAVRDLLTTGSDASLREQALALCMRGSQGALVVLRLIDQGLLPDALKTAALAAAAVHADSNVRVLFEKYLPAEARPVPLGSAIKADEVLALEGNAARGAEIFSSTAAQCQRCHAVGGQGGDLGPDLSQIGRKFERGTLLETILDPSKAIAPEFVPQIVETDAGQVYVGFVVENTSEQLVLKDAESKLIRLAPGEIVARQPQEKSLMPELLLRDVAAQDAADLLAYLISLRDSVVPVGRFRILGPLDARQQGLATIFDIEQQPAAIDWTATTTGPDGRSIAWELAVARATAGGSASFAALDLAERCRQQGANVRGAAHYLAVVIESSRAQPATLLVSSDDACRVWLNGEQVHQFEGVRALGPAQDRVPIELREGRNLVLFKVVNADGPHGAALAVEAAGLVQVRPE